MWQVSTLGTGPAHYAGIRAEFCRISVRHRYGPPYGGVPAALSRPAPDNISVVLITVDGAAVGRPPRVLGAGALRDQVRRSETLHREIAGPSSVAVAPRLVAVRGWLVR